jgi:peptidoglycan/LPS O-acetylase OafA/YrhL
LDALTGLRALAIVGVLVCHFGGAIGIMLHAGDWMMYVAGAGRHGVNLFFVLSGFILAHTYGTQAATGHGYKAFLLRRLSRVYPLHFLALMGSVAIFEVARRMGFDPSLFNAELLLKHVTLTQAWWDYVPEMWNQASWSLSGEWFVYLLYPLLMALVMPLKDWPALVVGMVAVPLLFVGTVLVWGMPEGNFLLFASVLPQVTAYFIAGLMAYRLWFLHGARLSARVWGVLADGGLMACFVLAWAGWHYGWGDWWMTLPFPFVIVALASGRGFVARVLQTKPAILWGKASFALYMTHSTLQVMMFKYWSFDVYAHAPALDKVALIFVYLAAPLWLGLVAHLFVEDPAHRWLNRRLAPRRG